MKFKTDIFEGVEPPLSSRFKLEGVKFPTSQEV